MQASLHLRRDEREEKGRKQFSQPFPPFINSRFEADYSTPRLCSPITRRPGLNAALNTDSAFLGSASPHMNTSKAAYFLSGQV
jgi:hypothetical protein